MELSGLTKSLKNFYENIMLIQMKLEKFCLANLILDLLRKATVQVKMFMRQWDGPGSGRYLMVFFVYKTDKLALILSARDMTKSERKRYEQT